MTGGEIDFVAIEVAKSEMTRTNNASTRGCDGRDNGSSLREGSMNTIKNFLLDEDGAVAVEYALLGALIALAIAAGAAVLGKDLCGVYQGIATAVSTNIFTAPPNFSPCS